ncbi:hypothetical protein C8J57DRAFT_1600751 [Mycena rebaudengoi]|nr:hypothetical protein C8J57DRAFT_1600751 [Mycena rebaudengoi]
MTDPHLDSLLSDTTRSRRSNRSDGRGRISELDARGLKLDAAAKLERQDLPTHVTHLGEYECPVLTLPTEITSEIFVNFLPPYPECPPATGLSSPELLGQICRTWREIAFGTPRLWRAIELHHDGDVSSTTALDLFGTWMSRSKNCPLSICVECDKDLLKIEIEVIPFVKAIIAHAERCEYIDLKAPLNLPSQRAKDVPKGSLSLFSIAPKLTKVTLSGYLSLRSAIELPWSQLTTISIHSLREAECVEIFQHAAALAEFCCEGVFRDDDQDLSPVAPLRCLQSLALGYHYRFLLDRLTTPALQHLSIQDSRAWVTPTIAKVHALILRSRCALASLRITRMRDDKEDTYRAAFPFIPTITVTEDWC